MLKRLFIEESGPIIPRPVVVTQAEFMPVSLRHWDFFILGHSDLLTNMPLVHRWLTLIQRKDASMKAFIEQLVQAVVDIPEEVRIEEEAGDGSTTYKVHVAASDLGKAIGKQGRIANAMRVLTKASAMKQKRKVYLEVVGAPSEFGGDVH